MHSRASGKVTGDYSFLQALEAVLTAAMEAAENAAALPTGAVTLLDLQDILTLLLCIAQQERNAREEAVVGALSCAPALPAICRAGNAICAALDACDAQGPLQIRCGASTLDVHLHEPS